MQTGTLIHGTLRPEDLIPAFYAALEDLAPLTAQIRRQGTYAEEIEHALNGTLGEYLEGEEVDYDSFDGTPYIVDRSSDRAEYVAWAVEALMEDLDANAPDGTYFGTLEGDGSDFGFWPMGCEHEGQRFDSVENGILKWYCSDCGIQTGAMPLIEGSRD